jgi:hypothetical protein
MRNAGIEIEVLLPSGTSRSDVAAAVSAAGIECVEEGYNHTLRSHWKVTTDASLGYQAGAELVSPILDLDGDGLNQIKIVCQVLQTLNAQVRRECGVHVHHDMRGEGFKTWKNIAQLFARYESALDSLVPRSRRANNNRTIKSNIQSVGGIGESAAKDAHAKLGSAKTLNELRALFSNDRYHKLNLESSAVHNTVEFRGHGGTVEFEKMEAWIALTSSIVEDAKTRSTCRFSAPDKAFDEMLKGLKGQPSISRFLRRRQATLAAS